MSDRFDITLERKLDTKPDGADDGPRGVRRIELITGTGRRRHWSTAERSRILLESLEPGANVSEVARRNSLSPQQLSGWRREARALIVDDAGAAPRAMPPPDHSASVLRRPKRAKAKAADGATPLDAEGVIAFARKKLVRYKAPRRVEFVAELPRDPMGKVRKRTLRDQFS